MTFMPHTDQLSLVLLVVEQFKHIWPPAESLFISKPLNHTLIVHFLAKTSTLYLMWAVFKSRLVMVIILTSQQ